MSPPTTGLFHTQSSEEGIPNVLTLSGQKMTRGAPVPLCCPQKKSPTSSHAPLTKAASAPCVCHSMLTEEMPLPPRPDPDMETASSTQNTRCCWRLSRAIRVSLSRLCCFLGAPNTQTRPVFNTRVAPLREAGGESQYGIPESLNHSGWTCLFLLIL